MAQYFFNAEWVRVDAVARVWIVGGKRDGAGRAHAKAIDAPTMPRDDEACGLRVDCAGAFVALNALKLDNCGVWMRSRVCGLWEGNETERGARTPKRLTRQRCPATTRCADCAWIARARASH